MTHNPTRLFIRFEFKDEHAMAIRAKGWHAWERARPTSAFAAPAESVLVARGDDSST